MEIISQEFSFPSVSGLCKIHAKSMVPQGKVNAVLQISHGMAEHSARYERLARVLCENQIAVFMSDHVGHGKSIQNKEMLGFFGEKDGQEAWVKDLNTVGEAAKKAYPDLPFFLLGHGMGSLIARKYTSAYPKRFDGVIYTGTNGKNPALPVGLLMANLLIALKGPKYKSKLLDNMAFGAYNKKTEQKTPCDWASRDEDEVQKFQNDELCGYLYSVSGLKALFKTVQEVTGKNWFLQIPKDLPIAILAGSMDPVGNYSKGPKETYANLRKTGHSDVTLKIYRGARHEILNEINREEVTNDILDFLKAHQKRG